MRGIPGRSLKQEALLLQRDRATRYVSKLVKFVNVSRGTGLNRYQTAKVIFKVIQGYWQRCHSVDHTRFPIIVPWQL